MSIVECRAWSVACCVSRVACRILLSLLATHALATGLASGANVGCADFEVEQPRPHGGIVRAEDFGFSTTNEDNAAAINRAIEACRRDGASRLELAPGTYRCHGSEGIVLDGCEDLTLDGKGALLVFWRKHPKDWDAKDGGPVGEGVNLFLNRCRRVRVENLTMDWDWSIAPLGFLGVCVDKHIDEADNASYVDFELRGPERHPLYPNPVPVQTIQPMEKDRVSGRLEGGTRCYFGQQPGHFGSRNEWISPTRLRVWPYVAQPDRPQDKGSMARFSSKGNRDAVARFDIGGVFAVSHRYYGMGGIYILSGEHITLSDVRIWSCLGTGICIDGTQKYTLLERFKLAPPTPEEVLAAGAGGAYPRCVTSTSDGTHVSRSGGFIKMVGCEWALHNDDSLNFHDSTTIARAEGPRTLRVVNNGGTRSLAAEPGAEIELRQEDYSITGWTGKIVSMDDWTFTFDRDLPPQKGLFFVLFNKKYATGNIIFRDCLIRDVPWGRSVILAPNVTFERCTFRNLPSAPLRFQTCYNYNVWCEGTGCTNVVVRGCTFENCAARNLVNGVSAQIYCGVRIPSSKGWPEKNVVPIRDARLKAEVEERLARGPATDVAPACHDIISDIIIEGNVFINPRGQTLYAENGDNIVFRDNKVEFDGHAPYELLSDAGKEKQSPRNIENRKDAQP